MNIVNNQNPSEIHFECNCGKIELDRIGLKKHYFNCQKAKMEYEELT
jgi:hypothetical protein